MGTPPDVRGDCDCHLNHPGRRDSPGPPHYSSGMASAPTAETVLRDLRRRRARGRHRPGGWELVAWVEVVVLLVAYAAAGLWLLVGGPPITGRPLDLVRAHGAAAAGLAVVLLV